MSAPATPELRVPARPPDGGSNGGVDGRITLGKELSHPPLDGISSLCFSRHTNHLLLVSSWDKTVRLYDAVANVPKGLFTLEGAVLDCCFADEFSGFNAGSDHTVRRLSFSTGRNVLLGNHEAPVRCVEYSYATGQLIAGSWDRTIKCWDPRFMSRAEPLVGTYNQPERVYSLSITGYNLVVATAGRHVNVYDLRDMSKPVQQSEPSLKHQIRCVECYPNGTGFALGSVEGRVAMEFFNLSESALSKRYSFKCHRLTKDDGTISAYPVNAIAFHPFHGTFATGGCDAFVNVWDGDNKRRLFQYSRYPTSIAALSFSRDGSLLAVASSYTYEKGDIYHEPDAIFIRDVNEVEVMPKPSV